MDKVSAIWGVVRHVLSFVGGALVALGVVSQVDWTSALSNLDTIVGAATAIVAVAASIFAKVKGFNWKNIFSGGSDTPPAPPAA